MTQLKDLKERLREIQVIYKKLDELGCSNEYNAIQEWKLLAQNFVKTGENSQGKIQFPEAQRTIYYKFTNRMGSSSTLEMKTNKE